MLMFFPQHAWAQENQRQQQKPFMLGQERPTPKPSSFALIEQAYGKGQISLDQRTLYLAYALFDPAKVPEEYRSPFPEKCGTWILDEIQRNWEKLSEQTKRILMTYGFRPPGILQRPTGLDSSRSATHFKIHYSVVAGDTNAISSSDGDGNGTPDYVDDVMTVLEFVWQTEITAMGYVAPPPDSVEGGDAKYDVYLMKIRSGTYGYVYRERRVRDNPNSANVVENNAYTSYMVLRNDYSGFPLNELQAIQVTSAHEFFHSIQNGYDAFEKAWMKEATATWCEDEVYDDINDNYQYLPNWFATPEIPLDADHRTDDNVYSGHWYGSWIFFRYISEHVGGRNTVRRIWERSVAFNSEKGDFSFNAINDALAVQGTNFEGVFRSFTVANLFRTITPYDYEEGREYPEIRISGLLFGDKTIIGTIRRRASTYIRVSPNLVPRGADFINFTFTPLDTTTRFGVQVVTRSGNTVNVNPFATNFALVGTQGIDEIFVIVMNFDTLGNTNDFSLRVQTNSALHRISWKPVELLWPAASVCFANGWTSWAGRFDPTGKSNLRYINDGISTLTFKSNLGLSVPKIGNGRAAWVDQGSWSVPAPGGAYYPDVVMYYNGTGVDTIHSLDWSVTGVLIYDRRLAISVHTTSMPTASAILVSEDGAHPDAITPWFYVGNLELFQLNESDVIWRMRKYIDQYTFVDTVFWYRNGAHIRPPTKFPSTVPKLDSGQLAWFESTSDNPNDSRSFEMFYYDGTTTHQLTTDSAQDGFEYEDFDIAAGKVAWIREFRGESGFFYVVALYDRDKRSMTLLGDTVALTPVAVGPVHIDRKRGYVAWGASDGPNHHNIFLYDGQSIRPIVPSNLHVGLTFGFAIDDGQIAFVAAPAGQEYDLDAYYVCLYTHELAVTSVAEERTGLPDQFALFQNYPNPFNPSTTIIYNLQVASRVTLKIFNLLGQEVKTLVDAVQDAGYKSIQWNGRNTEGRSVASGVYFYRLEAANLTGPRSLFIDVKKMLLLR